MGAERQIAEAKHKQTQATQGTPTRDRLLLSIKLGACLGLAGCFCNALPISCASSYVYNRLRFALRSLALCRVCAVAPSFVSGWRALTSVASVKMHDGLHGICSDTLV
jgi:hypothetical protein